MVDNMAGYLADPCSPKYYYMCRKDANVQWTATRMPCGPCTQWNQTILTCVRSSYDCHVTTAATTTAATTAATATTAVPKGTLSPLSYANANSLMQKAFHLS